MEATEDSTVGDFYEQNITRHDINPYICVFLKILIKIH